MSVDAHGSRAGSLLVVDRQDAYPAGSDELEFLRDVDLAEANAVFERVELIEKDQLDDAISEPNWLLLLGPEPIFLGRASLRQMCAAAARAAVPARLDHVDLAPDAEIHTLREYEVVENDVLGGALVARPADPPTAPALLVRADRLTEPQVREALADWRADRGGLEAVASAVGAESVGLCHCFVDYYGSVRDDVLPFLPEGAVDVLEVGCGKGFTGELLQRERGCRVTGVELNAEVAREARSRLHAVVHGDILTADIEGQFDVAILFDVVEHVVEAEALLRRVGSLVRPGGVVVISLPNVGHYSVVRDLLAGRWDYVPMGLLCYTHVRFFTRRTLEDWLTRCGFDAFDIFPRLTPLPHDVERVSKALAIDVESLRTHGFHVVIRIGDG